MEHRNRFVKPSGFALVSTGNRLGFQNAPYRIAKRAVSRCDMARFIMRYRSVRQLNRVPIFAGLFSNTTAFCLVLCDFKVFADSRSMQKLCKFCITFGLRRWFPVFYQIPLILRYLRANDPLVANTRFSGPLVKWILTLFTNFNASLCACLTAGHACFAEFSLLRLLRCAVSLQV